MPEGSRAHVRLLHPTEPDPSEKMSARVWNVRLKTWRRCLHDYDPGVDLPAPYASARWIYAVQRTAHKIPTSRLRECGEALERRARELSPDAALAALGAPADAVTQWNRARVHKTFQLLDQLDGAKGKGLVAEPKSQAQTGLYRLPTALSIRVASTAEEVIDALPSLTAAWASCPVLGLDTEWVASPSGSDALEERVVLLQLSTESHCLLVRLAAIDAVPHCLSKLLADDQVLKCGVSITHDVELLLAQHALAVHGAVDLAALAHSCGSDVGYKYTRDGLGLNAIIQSVLGYHLAKDVSVRCGDWSAELTAQQIYYAVCDAHAAQRALLQLYRSHAEAETTLGVFEWCCGHRLVDRAVGRPDRELMRSQAEKAQRALDVSEGSACASASGTSKEHVERAVAKAPIHASPPLSAVRSPDRTAGGDKAHSSGDDPQPSGDQPTRGVQPGARTDVRDTKSTSVGANDDANVFRASDITTGIPTRPSTPASSSTAKGQWNSAAEVRRRLFR
eukprot:COSAG02_NODE_236_length_27740_cov_49.156073_2_plen_507_part_00